MTFYKLAKPCCNRCVYSARLIGPLDSILRFPLAQMGTKIAIGQTMVVRPGWFGLEIEGGNRHHLYNSNGEVDLNSDLEIDPELLDMLDQPLRFAIMHPPDEKTRVLRELLVNRFEGYLKNRGSYD